MLNTLKFIKAVSGTVFAMINAVYHDKPLIFIRAVSNRVLNVINTLYCVKPLIFIGATLLEKLVSYHQAVSEANFCLLIDVHKSS